MGVTLNSYFFKFHIVVNDHINYRRRKTSCKTIAEKA
ncbi:hypothetical protein SAMN06265220_103197 [Flavobacterium nitrogenifigens]|uniref:Uncharacterized protein n=1 Tax=Flavobacterium nitrogenifigens TaxID=1617283 RepID=A0A521DN48_9FLAO|nr:hypothetical protein SAMN06265220_103197 [Flavobacterium nitrogenifigens]